MAKQVSFNKEVQIQFANKYAWLRQKSLMQKMKAVASAKYGNNKVAEAILVVTEEALIIIRSRYDVRSSHQYINAKYHFWNHFREYNYKNNELTIRTKYEGRDDYIYRFEDNWEFFFEQLDFYFSQWQKDEARKEVEKLENKLEIAKREEEKVN